MKYSHGAGGKVRNRGLSRMGVAKALKLCLSQGSKSGLVSVKKYGSSTRSTKSHQRCFPIRRAGARGTKKKACNLLSKSACRTRKADCKVGRKGKCKKR